MKKIIYYAIAVLTFINPEYSQAADFNWAKRAGGNEWDYGKSIANHP